MPIFKVNANKIKLLRNPFEFYSVLIDGIRKSKFRINLCSLYIGNGEMEEKLVDELVKASN